MKTAVKNKQTAVEWLVDEMKCIGIIVPKESSEKLLELMFKAKEMEKNNTDNKVIHFAEWLTKKHTTTLINLYEHFEEQYYNETFKSE